MAKWKTVRVRQELMTAIERTLETGRYKSLSEFVSEAIQQRIDELRENHETRTETPAECPVIQERLLCSPHHIWAMVTPDGNIKVGLSDYAQERLKGISNIQLEPVGHEVSKGKPFGSVETWMFKFDLYAPVSGRLVRANKVLKEKPFTLNEDPYEAGWIAEIKPNNVVMLEEELRDLMGSKQYKMWAIKQSHLTSTKP